MSRFIEDTEHEKISWKLPTGLILFMLAILVGFIMHEKPKHPFVKSLAETHEQLMKRTENTVNLKTVASVIKTEDKNYRFIDIRSPHEYIKGHIPGAINIPIHRLLDSEFKDVLNPKDGITNILYYSSHSGACAPWMILEQMGYKNNKIMIRGYQSVADNFLNSNNLQAITPYDEKANYDYAKVIGETAGAGGAASAPAVAAPAPIKKKKTGAVQGGC